MIDLSPLDEVVFTTTVDVNRTRLRFFANAIGLDDPIYLDEKEARERGHRDLVVPPTLFVGLELETGVIFEIVDRLGIDLGRLLHGEQAIACHELVHAGDDVTFETRVTGTYSKNEGALDFVERETRVLSNGELAAVLSDVLVVQNDRSSDE
jgi:hypothetical protein